MEITCWEQINETSENDLDTRLYKMILKDNQTEKQIEYFSEAMRIACEQSFKTEKATKQSQRNRSVPWWTHELAVMRKTTIISGESIREQETTQNKGRQTKRRTSNKKQNTLQQ